MSNKEIATMFSELAAMMEIHEQNEFKIKSYANAYLTIRKLDIALLEQSRELNASIRGIGTSIADKIEEIKATGTFKAYEDIKSITPEGIRNILRIKGLGPKKVKVIWRELEIESLGELLYACQENRLIKLKGFGPKIQEDVIQNIHFLNQNQNLFLYPILELASVELMATLQRLNPNVIIATTGDLRKKCAIVNEISLIANASLNLPEDLISTDGKYIYKDRYPVSITHSNEENFIYDLAITTGGHEDLTRSILTKKNITYTNEDALLTDAVGFVIPPECRDKQFNSIDDINQLIDHQDIQGVIHNHSTYSDGLYSVKQMAEECMRLGYKYFVISDHSKTATYANGLSIDYVEMQWREIDALNKELSAFKIYKSIESDILADGSLDYPNDVLDGFDIVIASIHQNLNMDIDKAMKRLITAIENPYTRILGHPTGRLLLSRQGYPVDHKRLIDACAANKVVIELNANPSRLDIDAQWIEYAQNKDVMISINPDAHNLKGIQDIRYGVYAARRGGLIKKNCLNYKSINEFEQWINRAT